ncbi:SDR family oxidoreductase, partial [Patescibacteria group bacterium]|nr:SDR family oxidoreductase [Patescibacteria group bacterium]
KKELSSQDVADRFLVMYADITKESDVKKVVQATLKKFKKIDVLFNNAGIGYYEESDKVDLKKFQKMIDINLVGTAALTKQVVPSMKKKKHGLIINMVSIWGKESRPRKEFYSATKFGTLGYSLGIRQELKPFKIRVATINPQNVRTAWQAKLNKSELARRKKEGLSYKGAMLEAYDIANLISFICSQPDHVAIEDVTIVPV